MRKYNRRSVAPLPNDIHGTPRNMSFHNRHQNRSRCTHVHRGVHRKNQQSFLLLSFLFWPCLCFRLASSFMTSLSSRNNIFSVPIATFGVKQAKPISRTGCCRRQLFVTSELVHDKILQIPSFAMRATSRDDGLILPKSYNSNRNSKNDNNEPKHRGRRKVDESDVDRPMVQKSPESNFWFTIPQQQNISGGAGASRTEIPAMPGLDRETGPLPRGAYITHKDDASNDSSSLTSDLTTCLIAVGIRPPRSSQATQPQNDGKDVWQVAVKNCQKLIDGGFNTFRMNNPCSYEMGSDPGSILKSPPPSITKAYIEGMKQFESFQHSQMGMRHEAERYFYKKLREDTPSSVLRGCHFMVNLEVPSVLSLDNKMGSSAGGIDEVSVPYGNGWMVRESVSDALLRVKGECLDSVFLEFKENSPYHLDILNTLFELKEEGLIRSISTQKFPSSLLYAATMECGFDIKSNNICGSLMNTDNLLPAGELELLCNEENRFSQLISSPLAGGLLTGQFSSFRDWSRLKKRQKKKFEMLYDECCSKFSGTVDESASQKFDKHMRMVKTIGHISYKHQVSMESVALRWLLQLQPSVTNDSLIVGTNLGMDFAENQGAPSYCRGQNLRQVFTFSLEDDDLKELCQIAGFDYDVGWQAEVKAGSIDFSNKALWLGS